MKRIVPAFALAVMLVSTTLLYGCSGAEQSPQASDADIQEEQSEEMPDQIPDLDELADEDAPSEEGLGTAGEETEDEVTDETAVEGAATGDAIADEVLSDQDALSEQQRNSLAMLNYLAVTTENINSSRNSRLVLEDTYSTLINNTYPNAVDDRTLAQLEGLLDTIEGYRMVDVKRDRLEYIYEQNQAQAMRAAMPNPLGLLSAVQSGNLVQLASSVVYMAVDSYTSYQSASSAAQLQYLMGGWELDDEESALLHERRKDTFAYMVRIVSDYSLPGYLALNEKSVDQLVEWASNDNVVRRIRFLESNQETYKAYGGYWLILSSSYYENGDYRECLAALATYEAMQSGILRKDYDYARVLPTAIVSASVTMDDDEYVSFAEERVVSIMDNCDNTDWALRYFAAQTYLDLFRRTENPDYLQRAYDIAYDNVNYLLDTQVEMNSTYLSPVIEAKAPNGATDEQKDEVKQYNKMLKETRKTELPPVYQPLLVNCDLLFALADELDISSGERSDIDRMLHPGGSPIFLTKPLDDRYRYSDPDSVSDENISFDGTRIVLPASLLSSETVVEVRSGSNLEPLPGDWVVVKVDRGGSKDVGSFSATVENKDARGSYSDGDIVTIALTDGDGDTAITREYQFRASVEERWWIVPDVVSFEMV